MYHLHYHDSNHDVRNAHDRAHPYDEQSHVPKYSTPSTSPCFTYIKYGRRWNVVIVIMTVGGAAAAEREQVNREEDHLHKEPSSEHQQGENT